MTDDGARDTRVIDVKGRPVVVRNLTDVQMALLMRYSRILQSDSVQIPQKLEAADKMFVILDSLVTPADREYVTGLQESGDLELKDLVAWIKMFQEEQPQKAQVRRGRATAKR